MKNKLTTHYCIVKECSWGEATHKIRDGLKCPKCNSPTISYYPNKDKRIKNKYTPVK